MYAVSDGVGYRKDLTSDCSGSTKSLTIILEHTVIPHCSIDRLIGTEVFMKNRERKCSEHLIIKL